jgi:hypothetical protein
MQQLIGSIRHSVPTVLCGGDHPRPDPQTAAVDVLVHCDRPGTSNGPTEAINGRLEHLRAAVAPLTPPRRPNDTITARAGIVKAPTRVRGFDLGGHAGHGAPEFQGMTCRSDGCPFVQGVRA